MAERSVAAHQLEARRASGARRPSLVLAGYDHGDGSCNALAYAAGLAARVGARLVVLNVNESLTLDCATEVRGCVADIADEVQPALAGCGGYEVTVDVGDPATVIQRVASELHADVIVVGQSRHRWVHPFGSVPGRLAHHAEQPVVIVP